MNERNDTELAQKVVTLQSRVRELEAERDRLATDFVHREKMAGLGQLAAGIAHEINNPIGFLTSNLNTMNEYCEVFKRILASYERVAEAGASGNSVEISQLLAKTEEMKKNEDIAYVLEDVESLLTESLEGVQRVRDIVVNLRNFARLDESDLKAADINDCIDQTLRVVWNELKYKCEVVKELDKLPQIPCYPGQINQVLMNLLVNAAQAIPEKGTIGIRTRIDRHSRV